MENQSKSQHRHHRIQPPQPEMENISSPDNDKDEDDQDQDSKSTSTGKKRKKHNSHKRKHKQHKHKRKQEAAEGSSKRKKSRKSETPLEDEISPPDDDQPMAAGRYYDDAVFDRLSRDLNYRRPIDRTALEAPPVDPSPSSIVIIKQQQQQQQRYSSSSRDDSSSRKWPPADRGDPADDGGRPSFDDYSARRRDRRFSSGGSQDYGDYSYNSYEEYYKTEDFVRSELSPPPPDDDLIATDRSRNEKGGGKKMSEHIQWLHDRWSRYDHPSFFSSHSKPEDAHKRRQLQQSRDDEDYKSWRRNSLGRNQPAAIEAKGRTSSSQPAPPAPHRSDFKQPPPAPPRRSSTDYSKPRWRRHQQQHEPQQHVSRYKQTSEYFNWMYGGRSRDEVPHMLTFKEFLLSFPEQDGDGGHVIDDEQKEQQKLTSMYNEYKLNFKKRAFQEFYEQHKDEEWFLEKYHPTYRIKRDQRRRDCIKRRLDVFMFLLVRGWIEARVEYTESRRVRKLLDASCVLLEGGKEDDITLLSDFDYILEEKREESYEREQESLHYLPGSDPDKAQTSGLDSTTGALVSVSGPERARPQETDPDADESLEVMMKRDEEFMTQKKKEDTTLEIMQHAKDYTLYVAKHTQAIELPPSDVTAMPDNVVETRNEPSYVGQGVFVSKPRFVTEDNKCLSETSLHKAASLSLRDISPKITRAELIQICSEAHGGFTRLSLSDPDPKRNFIRQGIVSFWHNANLMKICWVLRSRLLSNRQKLTVIEYRDFFSKRIATVDGLSADKSIVLRDIQLCKSLIEFLDKRHNLWDAELQQEQSQQGENATTSSAPPIKPSAGVKVNPLLVNLNECLTFHLQQLLASGEITGLADVDATAESADGNKQQPAAKSVERDENLVRILDRLILYLRIVHSVDYYGCKFYEKEDDEPRRIGLIHLRGPSYRQATPRLLAAHIQEFEERLHHLLPNETRLADEHVELLGMKRMEAEQDKFIDENVIEAARDGMAKCCACYKRFTNREFARQHFEQKHADKLAEFKLDLTAFNNYLYDPNRLCHVQFT